MFGRPRVRRAEAGADDQPREDPLRRASPALVGAALAGALLVALRRSGRPASTSASWRRAGHRRSLLGVVGQVGDLAESLFKREAGVKDSSRAHPRPRRRARPVRLALSSSSRSRRSSIRLLGADSDARGGGARLHRLDRPEHAARARGGSGSTSAWWRSPAAATRRCSKPSVAEWQP